MQPKLLNRSHHSFPTFLGCKENNPKLYFYHILSQSRLGVCCHDTIKVAKESKQESRPKLVDCITLFIIFNSVCSQSELFN